MPESVIIAKVPVSYTPEQKKELEKSIQLAVEQTKILVIPEEIDIVVLP